MGGLRIRQCGVTGRYMKRENSKTTFMRVRYSTWVHYCAYRFQKVHTNRAVYFEQTDVRRVLRGWGAPWQEWVSKTRCVCEIRPGALALGALAR
jgi:hypothetical protein